MEREIVVKGRGQAGTEPDRAVVHVTIDAEGSTREAAYNDAAPAAQRVDAVITARGAAIGRNTTAALVVHPKTRWRRGENVRTGWRASRTSVLEVVDFTVLGDLFAELAGAGATVTGPQWVIDADNDAYTEARRAAAEDARRRADVYAGALGLTVLGPAWVAEPGLRRGDDSGPFVAGLAMAGARSREGGAEDVIEIIPDEITVEAEVEVGFEFGAG